MDRHTGFCLVDAPSKEALQNVNNEAHRGVPHEIIEVDPTIVEAFLGRVKDPEPVGPHSGPIEESGDLYGKAVNFAARLCAHSGPAQILAAEIVRELFKEETISFVNKGEILPKGFTHPITIHEVQWHSE